MILLQRKFAMFKQELTIDIVVRLRPLVYYAAILCILQNPIINATLAYLGTLLCREVVELIAEEFIILIVLRIEFEN